MADLIKVERVADDDDDDEEEFFDNEDDDEIFATMDDSPMQIQPGLFIGSFMAEQNKPKLLKAGITHVLTVAEGISPSHPSDFQYKLVPVQDHAAEDMVAHFQDAFTFIDDAIGHLYPAGTDASAQPARTPAAPGEVGGGSSSATSAVSASSTPTSTSAIPVPGARSDSQSDRPGHMGAGSHGAGSNGAAGSGGAAVFAAAKAAVDAGSGSGPGAEPAGGTPSTSAPVQRGVPPKAGVLVHCVAGVSRSATICIGWLMWKHHLTYDEAFRKVHAVRPWVMPNIGFRRQLKEFEENGWDPAKWVAWRHRHPEQPVAMVSLAGLNIQGRPAAAASLLAATGGRLAATVDDENGRIIRKSLDDYGLGTSF